MPALATLALSWWRISTWVIPFTPNAASVRTAAALVASPRRVEAGMDPVANLQAVRRDSAMKPTAHHQRPRPRCGASGMKISVATSGWGCSRWGRRFPVGPRRRGSGFDLPLEGARVGWSTLRPFPVLRWDFLGARLLLAQGLDKRPAPRTWLPLRTRSATPARSTARFSSARKRKSYSAEPSAGAGRPPDLCDSYNRTRPTRAGGHTAERLAAGRRRAARRSRLPNLVPTHDRGP